MTSNGTRGWSTTWLAFALLTYVFAFASCSDPKARIAGQWKVTSDTSAIVWDFAKDGSVVSGDIRGRYSFGSQNKMKLQTPFATFVYQLDFTGDKMTWKAPNGSTTELTRVK